MILKTERFSMGDILRSTFRQSRHAAAFLVSYSKRFIIVTDIHWKMYTYHIMYTVNSVEILPLKILLSNVAIYVYMIKSVISKTV